MQHARPHRLRRAVAYAALAALLGVVSLTLSQCTMVGDSLTGVDLKRVGPTTCIKQCNDLFALLYKLEQKRHIAEQGQCQLLDGGAAKAACLAAEDAVHQANKAQLAADKTACQNNCYHEGAGSAG